MAPEKHRLYRAIEGWAHGFPGLVAHEFAFVGAVTASVTAVFLVLWVPMGVVVMASVFALATSVASLIFLRWRYDGRRDAMVLLFARRDHRKRWRILDDDGAYRRHYRGPR